LKTLRRELARFIATCCYVGYLPLAPGTWGTLLAFGAYMALPRSQWSIIIAFAVSFALGVWAAGVGARELWPNSKKKGDPGYICIDEFAAFFLAVMILPYGLVTGLFAVFLTRVFDIVKPFPARKCEKLPGGWGVMADDLVAGVYANVCFQILRLITSLVLV
jgi:phosphatidylglycerophosphatase A